MSTITHIHDPAASPTLRATALGLHSPDDGIVVVVARPGTRRDAGMFGALLEAIGKSTTNGSAVVERGPNNASIYAAAWLDANQIHTVVVLDANVAHPPQIHSVAETVTTAGCDLVVVTDGNLSTHHRKSISGWASPTLDETDGDKFLRSLTPAPQVGPDAPASEPVESKPSTTTVPATDFLTFRADAQDLLSPDEFSVVDDLYRATFEEFEPEGTDMTSIANEVHRIVTRTLDPGRQTVIIRAIQAKAFTQGLHVEIDLPGLLAAIGPAAAVRLLTDEQWHTIGRSMRPVHASIAGLTAAGLPPATIATLPWAAVDPDGRNVTADGDRWTVPNGAVPAVRAQYRVHQLAHLSPDDPFIWDTSRTQLRDISGALNDITREHGIKVRARFSRNISKHWQHQWGLKVHQLEATR